MEPTEVFWWFVLVGLFAQLVDGALGMAFGIVSSSILLSMGLPPATVSAAVHTAEVFTTGASGASHLALGNVDRKLFLRLALPGALGGVTGAYALTRLPADIVRPLVYAYLLVLAALILRRAWRRRQAVQEIRRVPLLGFIAGLLDASGGGGWGPMATSTLLARGGQARTTIGSVNAAEFVVTVAISITFFLSMGLQHLEVVLGLLVGGIVAAPLAAVIVKRVQERWVLLGVGLLVAAISVWQIGRTLVGAVQGGA